MFILWPKSNSDGFGEYQPTSQTRFKAVETEQVCRNVHVGPRKVHKFLIMHNSNNFKKLVLNISIRKFEEINTSQLKIILWKNRATSKYFWLGCTSAKPAYKMVNGGRAGK